MTRHGVRVSGLMLGLRAERLVRARETRKEIMSPIKRGRRRHDSYHVKIDRRLRR